jgi:hypothetical protein
VRGIPSPFINLDERGRDTPHASLLPLMPSKDLFAGAGSAQCDHPIVVAAVIHQSDFTGRTRDVATVERCLNDALADAARVLH